MDSAERDEVLDREFRALWGSFEYTVGAREGFAQPRVYGEVYREIND